MTHQFNNIGRPRLLGPRTKEEINFLGPRSKTQRSTDNMANYLVDKLNAETHRKALLKICWGLDDQTIHRLLEAACGGNKSNPRGYFIAAAKNEMRKRGTTSTAL